MNVSDAITSARGMFSCIYIKNPASGSLFQIVDVLHRSGSPAILRFFEDPWLSVPFSQMVWLYLPKLFFSKNT